MSDTDDRFALLDLAPPTSQADPMDDSPTRAELDIWGEPPAEPAPQPGIEIPIYEGTFAVASPAPARAAREYLTPAQRAAVRDRDSRRRTAADLAVEAQARASLDALIQVALVAPRGEYPHGALVGWRPSGSVPWHVVANAARGAAVAPPKQRSARAVAHEAVAVLQRQGYRVETRQRGSWWLVYRPADQVELGGSVGAAALSARLAGDTLHLDGPADLAEAVDSAFAAARRDDLLGTADVHRWLVDQLAAWRAVDTCYGRWLPAPAVPFWIALSQRLHDAGLAVPARPAAVAQPEDVRSEIAAGLLAEVELQVGEIRGARERAAARSTEREVDLGPRAAALALAKIADLRGKIATYELLTGPLTSTHKQLNAIERELEPLADSTAARGAVLELS